MALEWVKLSGVHPVQVAVFSVVFVVNTLVLAWLNDLKRAEQKGLVARKQYSWRFKRSCYWVLVLAAMAIEIYLDTLYEINVYFLHLKAYTFSWSVCLLDLYFSNTPAGVPMKCILGILTWVFTACLTEYLAENYWQHKLLYFRTEVTPEIILKELLCYGLYLPFVGACSDLFFSPIHRLMHHPRIYKGNHKIHHEFVNELTSLVQFHATLFDDLMMPITVTFGRIVMLMMVRPFMPGFSVSNWVMYLNPIHQSFSHAHDIRCAHIIAPIPEAINFSAYHYVHHLSPCNNYGLVEPTDWFWDKVLGVNTIKHIADIRPQPKKEA